MLVTLFFECYRKDVCVCTLMFDVSRKVPQKMMNRGPTERGNFEVAAEVVQVGGAAEVEEDGGAEVAGGGTTGVVTSSSGRHVETTSPTIEEAGLRAGSGTT